mmetsp:Transcript_35417/g.87016  ORF Transcript_35417/g.87016 Transcript_35417/m.87016 type:complete len:368 (-) Transcript_35417:235-1338(-)
MSPRLNAGARATVLAPLLLAALLCACPHAASARFLGGVSNYLRGSGNQFDDASAQQQQQPRKPTYWPWQQQPQAAAALTEEELTQQLLALQQERDTVNYGTNVMAMQGGQAKDAAQADVDGEAMPGGGREQGYTGQYGAGQQESITEIRKKIIPHNGLYGQEFTPGRGDPTGIDAGLVGGSQSATEFVKLRNERFAAQGLRAPDGYVAPDVALTSFQKTVVTAMLGPPTAKPGEPGCNIAAESSIEGEESKRIAILRKKLVGAGVDHDRASTYQKKLDNVVHAESARVKCTKRVLVDGVCNRMAAVEFIRDEKKALDGQRAKLAKTPPHDKNRYWPIKRKMEEMQAAYGAAVGCVKEVMGFDATQAL